MTELRFGATILVVLAACAMLAGCAQEEEPSHGTPPGHAHGGLVAGPASVLSPVNSNASPKDEDASIILAQDTRFYVAWLSNRDGNDDLYVMRSDNGQTWSSPQRVTTSADNDWYPTIVQTANGRFHMVWMRQTATTRTVMYNSSADGVAWSPADETPVTTGVSDDFVPHMAEVGGILHVWFDSEMRSSDATRNIFHVQATALNLNGSVMTWSAPAEINTNSASANDQFPFVYARPGGGYMMTFIRHTGSATDFNSYLDPSTDIHCATSVNGITWTYLKAVTPPDATVDTMPSLYAAGAQEIFTWMRGVSATPHVMELGLAETWPADAEDVTVANGVQGWSPRVVRTLKAGTFLRVFVRASDLRLMLQVFTR